MRSGVAAVILSVVWDMLMGVVKSRDWILYAVMILSFVLNYFLHVNVVLIILAVIVIGILRTWLNGRKEVRP